MPKTPNSKALVLFAHGSGSSRFSPRNQFVAGMLNEANLATLLFDLLTRQEEAVDQYTAQHRFNIGLLAERLQHATRWALQNKTIGTLPIGYFGSSTGGGAAIVAAAELPDNITAVVSRGGRPDWPMTPFRRCERQLCLSSAETTKSLLN